MIGIDGEIEHAAVILYPRFGKPVRASVEKGDDIMLSIKKMVGRWTFLVLPISNWSFDHTHVTEVKVMDASKPDYMLIAVAVFNTGRPLASVSL